VVRFPAARRCSMERGEGYLHFASTYSSLRNIFKYHNSADPPILSIESNFVRGSWWSSFFETGPEGPELED